MYTRSYYPESEGIKIPENYDGNAFREIGTKEEERIAPSEDNTKSEEVLRAPWDVSEKAEEAMGNANIGSRGFGSFFDKISLNSITGILPFFKSGKFSLGNEEMLICAIALFLFFSRGGDKECAVMLLLLLWIK